MAKCKSSEQGLAHSVNRYHQATAPSFKAARVRTRAPPLWTPSRCCCVLNNARHVGSHLNSRPNQLAQRRTTSGPCPGCPTLTIASSAVRKSSWLYGRNWVQGAVREEKESGLPRLLWFRAGSWQNKLNLFSCQNCVGLVHILSAATLGNWKGYQNKY